MSEPVFPKMPAKRLALVTGSGRNIGRAIALALAADGCDVVVNGARDLAACEAVAEQAREHGVEARAMLADVADPEAVASLAARVAGELGPVDVLVNNAAIRPSRAFLDIDEAEWRRVLGVDLDAAWLTTRAFAPAMIERGWGRIVNLTGMNAIHGYAGRAHVSAAKHGLWGLTKALAKEFGPRGVSVNAISPGPIRSRHDDPEMTRHIEAQRARIPLGRLGEPEEVGALCAFLASAAGGFVSGQMIACNGAAQT